MVLCFINSSSYSKIEDFPVKISIFDIPIIIDLEDF